MKLARLRRFLPHSLTFLGFVLRLYRIGYQSIWWDEAYSVHVAEGGLEAVLDLPASIAWNHPPLHYGLLTGWTRLAGFSELSIRYLSLFFGLLLVPTAYHVARRLFDRPTGLATMAVVALSPLYVTYSQEARVYALLPLLYLLLCYALYRLEPRPRSQAELGGRNAFSRPWLGLIVVEALILYSHFIGALGVLYANLFLLTRWLRRRGLSLRVWIGSQALVVLAVAPWVWNVAGHWDYVRSQVGIQEWQAVSPNLTAFIRRIWLFTVSGNLAAAGDHLLLRTSAVLLALLGAVALLLACLADDKRRRTGAMLAHGLVPLVFCFAFWQVWPQAQPRYTLVFSIPIFIAVGRALAVLSIGRVDQRLMAALLIGSLALVFGTGLYVQYFDEQFHKDDARGAADYLSEMATAQDVILIGPDDYAVSYYYKGPATVVMARDEPRAGKVQQLGEVTVGKQRFFLVHWDPSKADLHGLRPFLLERAGQLEAWRSFRGLDVHVYALAGPTGPIPDLARTHARFGPLLLRGGAYEASVASDNAVAIALRWQLVEPASVPYKVVVMLADSGGYRLSSADVLLLDEAGLPTHLWPVGAETTNFYVLPVPVGTPPLPHRLVAGVYDANTLARLSLSESGGGVRGQNLVLGDVKLLPGQGPDRDPYGTWRDVPWEVPEGIGALEGLLLEAFAVSPRVAFPGGQVDVLLRWRAEGAARPAVVPSLRLGRGDQVWIEVGSPLLVDVYPSDRWVAGEVVIERRQLTYPPRRGPADLSLVTEDRVISLGQVRLDESALLWELPAMDESVGVQFGDLAELLGYDLAATTLAAGEPFQLTLFWRAANDAPLETSFTVFTQLLAADGHLIAQHDGLPARAARPMTTWVGGEVIADAHTLTFGDAVYTGPAMLIVGLYDSATVTRVGTSQGQDHVVLSAEVVVTGGEQR
jgi:uncharacterized membrane protein